MKTVVIICKYSQGCAVAINKTRLNTTVLKLLLGTSLVVLQSSKRYAELPVFADTVLNKTQSATPRYRV